jgi:uracil-DNA glycosylase
MIEIKKLIKETVTTNWKNILLDKDNIDKYLKKPYEKVSNNILSTEYNYYPKRDQIFRALNYTGRGKVKVVILGQDPYQSTYKGIPYACGLSFSYRKDITCNARHSLSNIFKELHLEYPKKELRTSTDLEDWAKQGVILLNTVLTVSPGKSNSHAKLGWEGITDFILMAVSYFAPDAVYILLGKKAQEKFHVIHRLNKKPNIITAGHPCPLNGNNDFIGSNCFKDTNSILIKNKMKPIKWV